MSPHRGVVAAGHPRTARAAGEVLLAGGNAFDATVAAGFAASVTEPGLTSLGGGGFLLAHRSDGTETLYDFFVDTPGRGRAVAERPELTPVVISFREADQVFHAGHGSVAVPGCLPGYLHVHERLGRLPLADVVEPARRMANEGVIINRQQGEVFGLLAGIFTLTADGRDVFTDSRGEVLGTGSVFRNPLLAEYLADVGTGDGAGLAQADEAEAIEGSMSEHGGLLTAADLKSYRVVAREPLITTYRGRRIITNPPPSFGGSIVAEALRRLDDYPDGEAVLTPRTPRLAAVLTEATDRHTGDMGPQSSKGTTHISVADDEGNIAAMTTSNGSCSGVFAPGTGIQLNNIMGEEDLHPDVNERVPAGIRVGSMMAPTLLERTDGSIVALGSGGSERIRSAITQVIVNLVDHEMSLDEAILAPRLHWDGSTIQFEPGFTADEIAALVARAPTNEWDEPNLYFGGAHAVTTTGDAAGDPRRGGSTFTRW